jgi:adenylosuccinate synthase
MAEIPKYVTFNAGAVSKQLSDIDSFDPDTSEHENESGTMQLNEGINQHHEDQYERADVTFQDLNDLKVMVQQMKSNPALITKKLNELKSSWTTQQTAASSDATAGEVTSAKRGVKTEVNDEKK